MLTKKPLSFRKIRELEYDIKYKTEKPELPTPSLLKGTPILRPQSLRNKKYKDTSDLWFKLAFAAFVITEFLSIVLGLSVGEIDLGSPVGAALQFIFWMGTGAFFHSFKADRDERNLFRFGGMIGAILPVILIVFIAVGGILSYIALAIAIALCLFLGYLQRH